jgi:DNA-binding transcriptional regulator YdaS (Cro superfamily)
MLRPLKKAIKLLGGQTLLAKILGISQQTVSTWIWRDKRLPVKYVLIVEKLTDSRVLRQELRPDIYPIERSITEQDCSQFANHE